MRSPKNFGVTDAASPKIKPTKPSITRSSLFLPLNFPEIRAIFPVMKLLAAARTIHLVYTTKIFSQFFNEHNLFVCKLLKVDFS